MQFDINPLNRKRRLLYLKTQIVPHSKHFSSRLGKPISLCCKWHKSLFVLRKIQNKQIQCGQNVQLLNVYACLNTFATYCMDLHINQSASKKYKETHNPTLRYYTVCRCFIQNINILHSKICMIFDKGVI